MLWFHNLNFWRLQCWWQSYVFALFYNKSWMFNLKEHFKSSVNPLGCCGLWFIYYCKLEQTLKHEGWAQRSFCSFSHGCLCSSFKKKYSGTFICENKAFYFIPVKTIHNQLKETEARGCFRPVVFSSNTNIFTCFPFFWLLVVV